MDNRFGWERNNTEFLSRLAKSPKSKYIVLSGQQALYDSSTTLYTVHYEKVASIVDKVYTEDGFNQANSEVLLVFLGIDESEGKGQDGVAYWALDLTPKGEFKEELESLIKGKRKGKKREKLKKKNRTEVYFFDILSYSSTRFFDGKIRERNTCTSSFNE